MGFKKENYTRMGIAMPVLLGICMCLSVLEIQANTLTNPPESCSIGVLQEPRPTSRVKGTRHVQSVKSSYRSADWTGLKNGRILDDAAISTSLESGITSSALILNNFNFKIPTGSEIQSMEIYVDGKAVGDSLIDVRTKNFYLLDASGNPVGDNINNFVSLGKDWGDNPEFHQWRYGFSSYNWGGILSPELINSPNFGLSLDVKNHSDLSVDVFIDRIQIVVQYKPTYTVCTDELHKCIAFLGPRSPEIVGYTWTLPPGFKELDDSEPEVFNLLIQNDIVPGFYEVCVDVQYSSGTEQCCRVFEMVDCTPSSIGDRVWEDIDGNGVQDDGEPGVDGIQLELYNEIDQIVDNTTSGSDGSYSFNNVDRGCYYIKASNLNGYLPSIGEANVLDGSNGYGTTDYFTLDSDTSLVEIDLGLVRPAKISGTIWHDANADGTFADEPTLEGVSISLDGPDHTRTTTTDGSGNYTFDDLVPGDYKITASLLENYEYTISGVGAEDVNSDLNDMGMVSIEGIVSGDEVNDIDGGMFKRGTIGNYVWYDFNVNGIQDDGEDGIEGVQVMLMNADGLVLSSTTDADGSYTLKRVKPDNYFLAFNIDDSYIISLPNIGDDEGVDSDVESLQDAMRTADFEFSSCDTISNLDAGFIFKPGTIEGLVWSDDNRDGQRQPDESRSLSTVVTLYNDANAEIESKTVDGDRKYYFDQLQPGDFYIKFDAIEDHVFSNADAGDDTSDSDITDADSGTTDLITITPDLTVSHIDGGYQYLVSSIAGTVWEDEDRDNKRGGDENNFGGIAVNLYFSNGELVQSTTTESDGTYKFEELRKNDYYISFAEVEDYLFVTPNEGGESENSNVTQSITAGSTDMISLLADTDLTDINAGYILEVGTIRGETWEDEDLDGANNDNVSFEDIEVKLFDDSDNEMRSTRTDGDGTYTFELVPVGDYYVHFELPQRYIYAEANAAGDEDQDSDVDGTNGEGTTEDVSIDNQDDEVELDGGYVINEGRVVGMVWKDNDEDGQRQDDEPGMEGIEISLVDDSGSEVEHTTTTNEGTFAFEEITAGDYHVKVNIPADNIFTPPNQGDDATDSDISEENGEGTSDTFEVLTGRRTTNSDAGSVDNFGNIHGVAWCDTNEDGILEPSEELIEGINVDLLTEDGATIESTTTSANGAYSFLEVPAGPYYLVFEDETDKEFTEANVGDDELVNSAVNSSLVNGSTFVFRVGTGNKEYIKNAGYQYLPGSISGQAWKDDNSNAANDDNSPFEGIAVTLYDEANSEINSTSTDGSGQYRFDDIRRGAYYVVFGGDDDYLMIPSSESDDSDISNSTTTGGTDILQVIANRETENIDAGYLYARGSVTGNAFIDVDDNGLDDDNAPFQEVTVTLYNDSGEVSSTTTDGNGNYVFNDIYFGEYYVVFTAQENYLYASADAGDDTIDSDITGTNGDGSTDKFQILPNSSTENIDGGYFLAVGSVSGKAWIDDNDNATNDDGNGFEGIEVILYSSSGERTVTTTDSSGDYLFEDVLRGTYTIAFDTRDDYDFVAPNNGDEDKDSDITGANGDGSTDEITVTPREETKYVDGGYVLGKGSIAGVAWIDDNDNALNDDDQVFEGIEITLFTANGERTTTTTNAQGEYTFEDVFPGNYTIAFDTREDYEFVAPDAGDDTIDSDVTGANGDGSTDEITVGPRQEVTNIDGGYLLQTGSISGFAWMDSNVNDINDEDLAFEGIEITLYNASGDRTTATTNADGYYIFDDLKPAIYTISFEAKGDYDFVNPNVGEEDQDSDVTGANGDGSTDEITVGARQDVTNIDGGYTLQRGSISGVAWIDANENDINDDDMVLEGIEVTLFTATGERTTANTNAEGYYIFEDLVPAIYTIAFESKDDYKFSNPNAGEENQDSDVTGANGDGSTDEITVNPNEDIMNVDAGYIMLRGGISGSAWKDENGNGIYDGEQPFADVTVTLYAEDGTEVSSDVTNENGNFMFDDLSEGNYYIVFEGKDNYKFTTAGEGGEDEDSDVTGANGDGSTDVFQVTPGAVTEDIDAGYEGTTGSICGFIWVDDNSRDGINSEGDAFGVEMIVNLENSEGQILYDAVTDLDGGYCFDNIPTGEYRVIFYLLEGQEFVAPKQGDNEGIDSDVTDTENGKTDLINLNDGDGLYYDAGVQTIIIEKGSIAGKVWKDNNRDNVYNDGDDLVAGLGINLLSDQGEILGTTASGTDGTYIFDDLDDGQYVVFFENKEEQEFVVENSGDDESKDSDVIATVDTTGSFGVTDIILIEGGQNIADVDAGVYMEMMVDLGSISGTAWRDENMNNIDDDDSGLSGIEVRLFNSAGEELANTTTNDRGNYTFEDIEDGTYYVVFGDRENYEFSEANAGEDDTVDSDVTGSNGSGSTDPFEVIDAIDVEDVDAGYITDLELFSLSGRAFIDENNNNIDDDEKGLGDLEVFLLDSLDNELAITTTDDEGSYSFNNLEAGTYVVVFGLPAERDFVSANEGDDDTIDSDIEFVQDDLGATNLIVVNGNIEDIDAGLTPLEQDDKGTICGNVWNDLNENDRNDDDSPLADVEVILYNTDGDEIAVTFTDEDGNYTFSDLDEGVYYVFFDKLNNYDYVTANVGDDDEIDSEVTGERGDGTTNNLEIQGDLKIENIDAGYRSLSDLYTITGRAFIDSNEDNLDDDENGLSGIQVFLLDSLDNELGLTTTDADGNYSFGELSANSYVVVFAQPTDRDFVSANEGDDDSIDSDVEFVQDGFGATNILVLTGDVNDIDAGFTPTDEDKKGSIAGSVWRDENSNNLNDDNSPYEGIEVRLIGLDDDEEVDVTTTDASGNYIFTGIDAGEYYINFQPKEDHPFSAANEGDDDAIDSEVTGENGEGSTDVIAVADETEITGIDAGYVTEEETNSISGTTWIDANSDGLFNSEEAFEGIQVILVDSLDTQTTSTVTDSEGNYTFENLEPGTYAVVFMLPSTYTFSEANVGDDDSIDSDVEFLNDDLGSTNRIVVGGNIRNVDAGFIPEEMMDRGSISGRAWRDVNENNLDDDETSFAGVEVKLLDENSETLETTSTDVDGNYMFDDLDDGTYIVQFEQRDQNEFSDANEGDDDSIDSDVTGESGQTDQIVISENADIDNIDAGYITELDYYSISGKVWIDVDEDNLNNDNSPFEGIQVFLIDTLDAETATLTTDSLGCYSFENVVEGTYGVVFTLAEDYRFAEPNIGDDETLDSDVLFTQNNLGSSDKILVDQDIENVDAGYIAEESSGLSIAGNTFIDDNENGLDDDDSPYANVTVVLFDTTGVEVTRTSTDDMGAYSFTELDTGAYYLSFWLDSTYVFTEANIGDDDAIDSDVTSVEDSSGDTDVFDLSESVTDMDAGYISTDTMMVATGSLTGVVWEDTDPNGTREEDELGIQNIEVRLVDGDGAEIQTTTTDENGTYIFTDVPVGTYTVRFITGDDQTFVLGDQGDNDEIDSDVVNDDGSTGTYEVAEDSTVEFVDAGILTELPQASLCGLVWIDNNENGLQDEDEDGVIGIHINIYNENGEFVDSTRSILNGFYSLTDLLGGYYYLEFDTDGDYTFSDGDVGDDDGIDSDVTEENGEGTTGIFLGTGKVKLDAGLIPETGSYISGKIWGDTDEDNTYGDDDIVLEGREVLLVNRVARVIATTTTNADGSYRFDIDESGQYAVFFTMSEEMTFVEANAGSDDKVDSDVIETIELNGMFGTTDLMSFSVGQRIKNIDAGVVSTIEKSESITGVVWMDENEDGIRQDEESLLAGVEVKVFNNADELISTTTTDSDGTYAFSELESGDYYIQFTASSGEFVAANQGDDDTIDSDVEDLENGNTATFSFESGVVQSFDAGVMGDVEVNTICGTVWNDTDQNNINNSEQGRADHTVYLLKDGEAFDTTMTASDGTYSFANLEAGSYQVVVEQVEGYEFAEKDAGDDDGVDSDVNGNGESETIDATGKVTVDAGVYFSVVGISGKVWGDRDENNVYGDGDILIEGHLVFLVNRTARVLQTATTAADGTYRFEGLSSGMYAVFFDVGDADMFVDANAGDDEGADSDVTEIIDQIGPYAVTSFVDYEEDSSIGNIDAGLIRTPSTTGAVAGVVWIDSEQDGVRQDEEELFSGIEVKLFKLDGEEVSSATTDNAGAYEFSGVNPGEYYIEFVLNGREFVEANQGGDDRVDSDVEDLSSGRTGNFEVELDVTTRIDAGVQPAQTGVCGTVWFDFNENGQRDNDETGQADNEVKLYDSSGDEIAKTNTAANGSYSFPDVEAGEYYIEVFLGGAFAFTEAKMGDEDSDSDITEANGDGTSDTFTYESGLTKVDAGQISIVPSFVSGKVWEDKDGDHVLNNDDEVLGGFNVYLQFNGEFIDTAVTEPDGTYIFENLAVGNYTVYFEQPDGKFFTLPNIPDEENKDSDVLGTEDIDGATFGFTEVISIGSGQVKVNVDAGITATEQNPGSIAGGIWLDDNEDNKFNEGEGPVEGVVVTLYDAIGSTQGMFEIGEDGTYKFDNLIPGNYAVQFTIPAEYNFVEADQGDEDEDSDVFMFDGQIGVTNVITVGDGEDVENVDAGLKTITVNFSTIGDYVWLDFDEDGVLDNDEFGMNEVNVELFDATTDEMVGSMLTTDHPELREPGYYSFTDLPDGDYYLRFNLPNGYIFSNPKMGNEVIKDSDVTGANGTGTTNTITVEKIKMTDIDVGAISTSKAVVGDFVFNDRNSNGIQDVNEDGINNIRVRLFDMDNQQVAQTFTKYNSAMDRAGYFSFKVNPGTYFLRFDISQGLSFTQNDIGDNDERDSDVNGENGFGTTSLFTVDLAETNLSLDAGLITEPANLGDQLWVDENSNGVQDDNEEGLNGIEVSLYDKDNNLMISTTTESNNGKDGYYIFENISAGSYYISFDMPEEYVSTTANVGGNDAEDSDITNVFGKGTTSLFTLSSGEDELDIDGGIVLASSVGDYVWEDTDGDGIQDNDESGRAGVFIRLTDESGTVVDTTSTDDSGAYTFDGLVEGNYILEFDIPSDRSVTSLNVGSDDELDSDIDEDGKSPIISVGYNEEIDNVDLGLVSNTVAFDSGVDNELIAKVYPNPSIRFVTISTNNIYQSDTDLKEVKIFNGQGAMVKSFNNLKTLKSEGNKSYELDLEGMQPGVYYIRAKVGRLTYKKKLILINN